MLVKTSDLPGIGKRYSFSTAEGPQLVVIIHHSGAREIYFFQHSEDDEPNCSVRLADQEARQLGTLLLGADFQPVADDRVELWLNQMKIEWLRVAADSELANRRIVESSIRSRTGATIIGIQRGDEMIGSPEPQELILPGDILMVVGRAENTRKLEQLCSPEKKV